MIYDGLWWFMMVYDGLWWFMMVYDTSFLMFGLELNSCLGFRGYVKGIQRSVWTENVVGRNIAGWSFAHVSPAEEDHLSFHFKIFDSA